MLDIKYIRDHQDIVKNDLKKRKDTEKLSWVDDLIKKEEEYRKLSHKLQEMRHKRNTLTSKINELKKAGKDIKRKIDEMKELPQKIKDYESRLVQLKQEVDFYLQRLPNILHESVPVGEGEENNQEIRKHGKILKPKFELKSHVDLLELHDFADTERAGKVAGSRFFYLKGDLALLELALQRFASDFLAKKGYTIMQVPLMINRKAISGAVTLSDFEDVIYKIEDEDLYLIATSEHSIVCYHMDETIDSDKLPLRYAGISSCFRKEAGSHGKDTKGIFRVHQFNKIEQFIFSKPEDSWRYHEELISNAEELFKLLELPYRVVNVCTGDIGAIAAKKYDLEVWMPFQKKYREMVSCSNCTDYQARKLNIRYGTPGAAQQPLLHTLNATAIATSRTLAAILENFQQEDCNIKIPKALQPYMGSLKIIGTKK